MHQLKLSLEVAFVPSDLLESLIPLWYAYYLSLFASSSMSVAFITQVYRFDVTFCYPFRLNYRFWNQNSCKRLERMQMPRFNFFDDRTHFHYRRASWNIRSAYLAFQPNTIAWGQMANLLNLLLRYKLYPKNETGTGTLFRGRLSSVMKVCFGKHLIMNV